MKNGIGCSVAVAMALGIVVGGVSGVQQVGGGGGIVSVLGASIAEHLMSACAREELSVDACKTRVAGLCGRQSLSKTYPVSVLFDACWRRMEAQP